MCGIAGIFAKDSVVNKQRIQVMTDALQHRGPDAEGQWISKDQCLGLGHRRLSIIDTSDLGIQPMHYLNRYTIVFNGEIYNYVELQRELLIKGYQFHSKTDTEVLLALYDLKKEKCLNDLDGMFAFCIWDEQEHTLFCARDRFGEKPFYYAFDTQQSFLFASEMKALFAAGIKKDVNNVMLYNYLTKKILSNPWNRSETFYNGIYKLEPSSYCILKEGRILKKEKYWKLHPEIQVNISFDDAVAQFKTLLLESVKKRLRSDVAIGSSLSGGLDSSTLVAILHSLNPSSQHTFSASFPGYAKDETRYMNLVIKNSNVIPHFTMPDENQLAAELDLLFFHQEEPFGSASIFAQWKVMQLAKQNSIVVLMDGQGADELLAGYTFYYRTFFQELYAGNRKMFQEEYDAYAESGQQHFSFDWKFKLQAKFPALYNQYLGVAPATHSHADIHPDFYNNYKSSSYKPTPFRPLLNHHLSDTLHVGGFEDMLRYADRNAMAFSREVRMPYLSHQLVEFSYSLPSSFKIHKTWSKYLLRKAYEKIVPPEISWRKDKIGYTAPESQWMQTAQMQEIMNNTLNILEKEKIINRKQKDSSKSWTYLMISKLLTS